VNDRAWVTFKNVLWASSAKSCQQRKHTKHQLMNSSGCELH